MNYSVYVLLSGKDNKLYVGQTNNLPRRLESHFSGKVFSTKNRLPLVLTREENFKSAHAHRHSVY